MANPYFIFKEFTIYHDRCAMKVGTDGVLLGAWTHLEGKKKVLDIGAGSGLVSLMLAQRNPESEVESIEIDAAAAQQAEENVENNPSFSSRVTVRCTDFVEWARRSVAKYDLIVSNPPFFKNSLKSPSDQRTAARHGYALNIDDLIGLSAGLLSPNGAIALIYPAEFLEEILRIGRSSGLFPSRVCKVFPKPGSPAKRVLVELSFAADPCEESELTIEMERHVYTEEFRKLTQEFYLDK